MRAPVLKTIRHGLEGCCAWYQRDSVRSGQCSGPDRPLSWLMLLVTLPGDERGGLQQLRSLHPGPAATERKQQRQRRGRHQHADGCRTPPQEAGQYDQGPLLTLRARQWAAENDAWPTYPLRNVVAVRSSSMGKAFACCGLLAGTGPCAASLCCAVHLEDHLVLSTSVYNSTLLLLYDRPTSAGEPSLSPDTRLSVVVHAVNWK